MPRHLTVTQNCKQCGKPFQNHPRRVKGVREVFCGLDCATTYRFWLYVNKNGPVPPHRPELGPCWVWTGHLDRYGYGKLVLPNKKKLLAHRLSKKIEIGRFPAELTLHRCDNRACVRPTHLFTGTPADNSRDMVEKGRKEKGEENHAHKLTEVQVLEIRSRVAAGEKKLPIAKAFGVSHRLIRNIVDRKAWKHI